MKSIYKLTVALLYFILLVHSWHQVGAALETVDEPVDPIPDPVDIQHQDDGDQISVDSWDDEGHPEVRSSDKICRCRKSSAENKKYADHCLNIVGQRATCRYVPGKAFHFCKATADWDPMKPEDSSYKCKVMYPFQTTDENKLCKDKCPLLKPKGNYSPAFCTSPDGTVICACYQQKPGQVTDMGLSPVPIDSTKPGDTVSSTDSVSNNPMMEGTVGKQVNVSGAVEATGTIYGYKPTFE